MTRDNIALAERLQRASHRICSMILNSDLEWIDIAIEINRMRELCEMEAPEKLDLFEAVYVGRFTRLWQQWRLPDEEGVEWPANERAWREELPPWDEDEDADGWGLTSA